MPPFRSTWVFVITLQPIIILWLIAIAFFIGLAVAAALSPSRTWRAIILILLTTWAISALILILMTNWLGIHNFLFEYFI